MTKFRPQNKVQKLAYERRGIKSQRDFEQAMGGVGVARTTARYWWVNGLPSTATRSAMETVANFLGVSLDELGR